MAHNENGDEKFENSFSSSPDRSQTNHMLDTSVATPERLINQLHVTQPRDIQNKKLRTAETNVLRSSMFDSGASTSQVRPPDIPRRSRPHSEQVQKAGTLPNRAHRGVDMSPHGSSNLSSSHSVQNVMVIQAGGVVTMSQSHRPSSPYTSTNVDVAETEQLDGGRDEQAQHNSTKTLPMQTRAIRLSSSGILSDDPKRISLSANCTEKIIFCLDTSSEMTNQYFISKTGDKEETLSVVKKALRMFTSTKSSISPRHEYGLMLLGERAVWMSKCNSDSFDLMMKYDMFSRYDEYTTCDLSSIFEEVDVDPHTVLQYERHQHVSLPDSNDIANMAVPFTVRVILIYGRSHCIPQLVPSIVQRELQASPYFFIDVLYLHEPASPDNQCEKIFDVLCNFDSNGTSYILEAAKNLTKIYDCLAQLLGHPLQRALQQDVNFVLE